MPIREIARRTGLSRNTIKKDLRDGGVEPKFKTSKRPSKLDPYADRLSAWLLIQTRKPRKERRTVKQMHADLVKLGYDGSYARVAAFARTWRADRHRLEQTAGRGTYVPLVFQRGIYDNMKTAVDRVGKGKQRDINARFNAMASHYVFEPEFCNPAAGWEKGQVEKNVQDARIRLCAVALALEAGVPTKTYILTRIVQLLVRRVTVTSEGLVIDVRTDGVSGVMRDMIAPRKKVAAE